MWFTLFENFLKSVGHLITAIFTLLFGVGCVTSLDGKAEAGVGWRSENKFFFYHDAEPRPDADGPEARAEMDPGHLHNFLNVDEDSENANDNDNDNDPDTEDDPENGEGENTEDNGNANDDDNEGNNPGTE